MVHMVRRGCMPLSYSGGKRHTQECVKMNVFCWGFEDFVISHVCGVATRLPPCLTLTSETDISTKQKTCDLCHVPLSCFVHGADDERRAAKLWIKLTRTSKISPTSWVQQEHWACWMQQGMTLHSLTPETTQLVNVGQQRAFWWMCPP